MFLFGWGYQRCLHTMKNLKSDNVKTELKSSSIGLLLHSITFDVKKKSVNYGRTFNEWEIATAQFLKQ